jgi:hypothetical protein
MKLPSLWPVACFAGGILLFGKLVARMNPPPRTVLLAAASLLLFGFVLLYKNLLVPACIAAAAAWLCLGYAAAGLERNSTPANLASVLIESGKLDSSTALRWRGRLRADPLALPWGTRYEINLQEVESAGGVMPVSGGLRVTSYTEEQNGDAPPWRAQAIVSKFLLARSPSAISAIPAASTTALTSRFRASICRERSATTSF